MSELIEYKEDGYFIYEPEPTFKEVIMYAPVVKSPWGECLSTQGLAWNSIENVMKQDGAIGYIEVKVFLKTEGGGNEPKYICIGSEKRKRA